MRPLLLLLIAAAACHRGAAGATAAVRPQPATATRPQPLAPAAHGDGAYLGVVVAPEAVDVTSQLEARVVAVDVRPGDHVARGAAIATLDTRSARRELAIAAAEVAAAHAELERARIEASEAEERLRRRQTVVVLPSGPAGTSSGEEVATARYQAQLAGVRVESARAGLAAKQAHLDDLRALLDEGLVRAPFDGVVTARYVDGGALLHKGSPLVRVIADGSQRVRFAVPEDRADSVAAGDGVVIRLRDGERRGTVDRVAPEIDAASRMLFVEVTLDAATATRARSGEIVRVRAAAPAPAAR